MCINTLINTPIQLVYYYQRTTTHSCLHNVTTVELAKKQFLLACQLNIIRVVLQLQHE